MRRPCPYLVKYIIYNNIIYNILEGGPALPLAYASIRVRGAWAGGGRENKI